MARTYFTSALLFLALALGCGGGGSSEPVDSVTIASVTSAPAADGVSTDYTITVSYELQTADNAVIDHCYEDPFSDRWTGCPIPIGGITGISVDRGTGTITTNDTEAFTGTKLLYVVLVPGQDSSSLELVPGQDLTSVVGAVTDVQMITVP